ncbi:MAG: FadR family transcriptional regulator [Clostridiales bacterium]|nr:FadR family transcriptional regulator [Clostridiales bacterium]
MIKEQKSRKKKETLGMQIEGELIDYIRNTPVEIGTKIPNEFMLAEMFDVGRGTVREAVKGLVTKGILEVRQGDGTYVRSYRSLEQDPLGLSRLNDKYRLALDLFDVRLMLEPEIAARAADHANEEDMKQLVELCDTVEQLYLAGEDHIEKDIEFHTCIAQCSKNKVVETLIPIINSAVMTFANLTKRTLKDETIQTHRAITNAILTGDSVGARCAMIMHLTYNRQMILKMWHEREDRLDSQR